MVGFRLGRWSCRGHGGSSGKVWSTPLMLSSTMILRSSAGQDRFHRFEVKPLPRDLRRFIIFSEQQRKLFGVALGAVHAAESIGFGLFLSFFGLAARIRDGVVVNRPCLVDCGLLFLLCLIDFVEGRLHRGRRTHSSELHLLNLQTEPVFRAQLRQPPERRGLDIVPADGQDFIDRAIADDFAHHAFGEIAQRLLRLARAEEILLRVGDPVLHDPWDEGGIEVARDHRLGVFGLLVALKAV